MITPLAFSPVERLATEISYYLRDEVGVKDLNLLTFSFDDLPDRRFPYNPNGPQNQSFGFKGKIEENLRFLETPEFSGSVEITYAPAADGPRESVTRRFTVINCLRCSERLLDPTSEIPKNVHIGSRDYSAVEAKDTMQFKRWDQESWSFDLGDGSEEIRDARQYAQYRVIARDEDGSFLVLGPSHISNKSFKIGMYKVEGREFEISVDEDAWVKYGFGPFIENVKKEDKEKKRLRIILKEGPYQKDFEFGQTFGLFNGAFWDGFAYFSALRIVTFVEMNSILKQVDWDAVPGFDETNYTLTLELITLKGKCYLTEPYQTFDREFCVTNEYVKNVLERFNAVDDTFQLSTKGGALARVSSSLSTEACFVWGLARLLTQTDYVSDSVVGIRACLDADIVVIADGQLHGNTASISKKNVILKLATTTRQYSLTRKTYYKNNYTSASDGYFLFGWDRDEKDIENGDPTHWVLAKKTGSSLTCVFDPYRYGNYLKEGDNLNYLLEAKDVQLACFVDENESEISKNWAH